MKHREFKIFLIVGLLNVGVDYSVYHGLIYLLRMDINISKAIAFVAGALFAYVANRFWTFRGALYGSGSFMRFATLYAGTLIANVVMNWLALNVFDYLPYKIQLAYIVTTGATAALNFMGMKFYVFRTRGVLA
jgi:putative flippase GtrA